MKQKIRLDILLTEKGLADSRSRAQAMIMAGDVYVSGQKVDKPGTSVDPEQPVEVRGASCPYVSRGGLKLEKALRDFRVDPTGFVCSDSGASTGGFTDCLLQCIDDSGKRVVETAIDFLHVGAPVAWVACLCRQCNGQVVSDFISAHCLLFCAVERHRGNGIIADLFIIESRLWIGRTVVAEPLADALGKIG